MDRLDFFLNVGTHVYIVSFIYVYIYSVSASFLTIPWFCQGQRAAHRPPDQKGGNPVNP